MRRRGSATRGRSGSRTSTGRISIGRSATAIARIGGGRWSAIASAMSRSERSSSGGGTAGIGSW
jgi:hypothetical protein